MTDPAQLETRLETLSGAVERWTQQFFQHYQPAAERFRAMLGYPLGWYDQQLRRLEPPAPAGKRLRPALCLLICEAVGGDHRPALGPASAVELIHNFSLVHDDIQDESDLRRSRPTVWAGFGAAQALNVGDSLFALAQLALVHERSGPPTLQVEAVARLNQTCLRLVEGQFLDLDLQTRGGASFEAYQNMIAGKTAALLECAAWLGARYGGAERAGAERFASFARELGLAFQYQDDVLGLWGDPALTGKSAETDLLSRKQALPAVLALQSDGPVAERFRALFSSPEPLTPAAAGVLLEQLGQLDVRRQAERLVESGYQRTAAALREALDGRPAESLWLLLERFRTRRA